MVVATDRAKGFVIAASIAVGALTGCAAPGDSQAQIDSLAPVAYAGVLPCADCAGIRTEVKLYAEQPSGRPVRYEFTQTYLGTRDGDRSVQSTGRWTILRGSSSDRDATVYQLDYDRPGRAQNFLKVGDDELRQLDRDQKEIASSVAHSLYRVSKESSVPAVTLTESDAGHTIDVNRGERIVIRLRGNRTTGYTWTLAVSDPDVLTKLAEPTYTPDDASVDAVGAGGVETWSFQASRGGRAELRFEYRRPWEHDASATRTVSYTINVR
jgi:copper homeostasis protein (lipoprotein)